MHPRNIHNFLHIPTTYKSRKNFYTYICKLSFEKLSILRCIYPLTQNDTATEPLLLRLRWIVLKGRLRALKKIHVSIISSYTPVNNFRKQNIIFRVYTNLLYTKSYGQGGERRLRVCMSMRMRMCYMRCKMTR